MRKDVVSTDQAPAAIGPYSQAVRAGGLVFVSGQIPISRDGDPVEGEGIELQTERVLTSLRNVLEAAGSDLDLVVKVTVFMTDLAEFPRMNEVYARFFDEKPPARSTVQVAALPKAVRIEIDAIALDTP